MSVEFEYVSPTANAELLIFLLDGSGSMRSDNTQDGRPKSAHLDDLVRGVLERLCRSDKAPAFRVAIIRFGNNALITSKGGQEYFTLNDALSIICPSRDGFEEDEGTDMILPLKHAARICNEFYEDEDMPREKSATVFLFTDGKHREDISRKEAFQDVANVVGELRSCTMSPTIATISIGIDAENDLLLHIASTANHRQLSHLDNHNLLDYITDRKLYVVGHINDVVGSKEVEIIRNFVITLSSTVK